MTKEVHCGHCALSIAEQRDDGKWTCFTCGRTAADAELRDVGDYRIISAKASIDAREPLKRLTVDLMALTLEEIDEQVARDIDCRVATLALGYVQLPECYPGGGLRYGYRDGPGIVSPGQSPDMLVPHFTKRYDAALRLAGAEEGRRFEFGTNVKGDSWAYAHFGGDDSLGEVEGCCNEPTAITAAILTAHVVRLEAQAQEAEAVA
ncbi:MAG: hypothetical protein ACJ75S_06890 [Solirubrobacterales bacterium]